MFPYGQYNGPGQGQPAQSYGQPGLYSQAYAPPQGPPPSQSMQAQPLPQQQQQQEPANARNNAIPDKRLSFLTASDQHQFSQLFLSAVVPGEQALSGDAARSILLRSNLPSSVLGDIWQLSDTQRSGKLLFPEFCLAMYLCSVVLRGEPLPRSLHPGIEKEVNDMVDQISFSVPDGPNAFDALQQRQTQPQAQQQSQPQGQFGQTPGFAPQVTGFQPQQTGFQPQQTGFQPQQTGFQQQQSGFQPQPTGGFQPQSTGYSQLGQQQTGAYQQTQPPPLQSQITGGYQQQQPQPQPLQQQRTGGYQPQVQQQSQSTGNLASLIPQTTGGYTQTLQSQITGFPQLQSQATGGQYGQNYPGYSQPQPQPQQLLAQRTGEQQIQAPLQTQNTGGYANSGYQPLQSQVTGGTAYLTSQPTGKPGQWGFVNAPTPGMANFSTYFMPDQNQSAAGNSELKGNAQVHDAISKQEKTTYDGIFTEWDRSRSGYIDGATAIEIFGKSGLERPDLEAIWNLSDPQNRGKLGRDEFAVAMHLVYRKLNGYEIPSRLPPELIPPSTRHLNDTVDHVKGLLRRPTTDLSSQGVSYLKSRSFNDNKPSFKQDATVFKNNDDDLGGYKSAARHRAPPASTKPKLSSSSDDDSSLAGLAKQIEEKKILLEALDAQDEEDQAANESIEYGNAKAVEDLKQRIRKAQVELDSKASASGTKPGSSINRRDLTHKLETLTDSLPQLTTSIRKVEQSIALAKVELARKKYEKENPGLSIRGSGENGAITENDRAAARRRAELKARMSALTGKKVDAGPSFEDYEQTIVRTQQSADQERETNEQSLRALEESARSVKRDLDRVLRDSAEDIKGDRDRRRWEEAVGVEDSVKEFILSLRQPATPNEGNGSSGSKSAVSAGTPSANIATSSPSASAGGAAAGETPAERVARIRAEAERRTRERLEKAGIRTRGSKAAAVSSPGSSARGTPEVGSPAPTTVEPTPQSGTKAPPPAKPVVETLVPAAGPAASTEEHEDSDNDEESRLAKELEERRKKLDLLEQERAQKTAARKEEKAKRLAALKAQQDELAKREQTLNAKSDDDWDDKDDEKPAAQAATTAPAAKKPFVQSTVKTGTSAKPFRSPFAASQTEPAVTDTAVPATASAATASTAKVAAPPVANSVPAAQNTNPFQRPAGAGSNGPTRRAPADDDAWGSSDDNHSDDDDRPGAATPAHLASLLFGTMGPGRPQRSETATPTNDTAAAPAAAHASARAPTVPAPPAIPVVLPEAANAEPTQSGYSSEQYEYEQPAQPPTAERYVSQPSQVPPVPPVLAPPVPQYHAPEVVAEEQTGAWESDGQFEDALDVPVTHPLAQQAAPAPPPPVPSFGAPPVPPVPGPGMNGASGHLPPPPPPPPPMSSAPPAPAGGAPPPPPPPAANLPPPPAAGGAGGMSGLANLLGDISAGKALRKVQPSQQKISESNLGRVV